jgi:hypothetical protein
MTTPDSTQLAKAKFLSEWEQIYSESPPISQFFKFRLPKRWARIHSLPESKRYPDTKPEWDVLLDRQNRVIDSLMPQQATIRIIINYIAIDCYLFKSFDLGKYWRFCGRGG